MKSLLLQEIPVKQMCVGAADAEIRKLELSKNTKEISLTLKKYCFTKRLQNEKGVSVLVQFALDAYAQHVCLEYPLTYKFWVTILIFFFRVTKIFTLSEIHKVMRMFQAPRLFQATVRWGKPFLVWHMMERSLAKHLTMIS